MGKPYQLKWETFSGGVIEIGHLGDDFCYDNETPRHKAYLQDYQLASRLVSNGEYAEFVAAGGYSDPRYWLAEGWDWHMLQGRNHPLYWSINDDGWSEFTLNGLRRLDVHLPVIHVSYYEADAYARWLGNRLPTEVEWEHASANISVSIVVN